MNPENYDPPSFEEVMRGKEDTITALRAEVDTWKGMLRQAESDLASVRSQLSARDAQVRALQEAVQVAYGFLWCVNNEPGTPHRYSPEKAAYEARKVLRDLLTHEQRGAGINAAIAVVRATPLLTGEGEGGGNG